MAGGGGRGGGSRGGRGTGNGRGANYQQHQSGGDSGQGGRGSHTQIANSPPPVQKWVNQPVQGQEGANRLSVAGLTSSGGATGARERGGTWSDVVARNGAPPPQPQREAATEIATEIDIPASLSLFVSGSSAIKFNGLNYTNWSEQIHSTLDVMNLDIAIVSDEKPAAITETSSEDDKSIYEAWERSNMLSLYLMEMTMTENIKPLMPKTEDAREFMRKVKEYSQSDLADKSIVGSLMDELTKKKFDWSKSIHDHVTAMSNLAGKLKTMGIDVSDTFLVQFIMNSLPAEFLVNYNTMQDKWNFKELKAMLVHEEARLKKIRCFFCNKEGHVKVDCPKRKEWFEKKCTYYADLVAYRGRMYHDAMMERQSCGFMLT